MAFSLEKCLFGLVNPCLMDMDYIAGNGIKGCMEFSMTFLHDTWFVLVFFDSAGWSEAFVD